MTHGANKHMQAAKHIATKGKRIKDMAAPSRGERETTHQRTRMTCQSNQVTRLTLRQHTREGGDIDPFPDGNNNENKAHILLDIGKGTLRKDPTARRNGCGGDPRCRHPAPNHSNIPNAHCRPRTHALRWGDDTHTTNLARPSLHPT